LALLPQATAERGGIAQQQFDAQPAKRHAALVLSGDMTTSEDGQFGG
jgi:hypothetical protein